MGGIVAEASGVSIQKEVRETIDAVAAVTKDMPSEEGATADKIAKLLRLDRSSAWRRLRLAMNNGFVVNLETRRGQPGRYRVTSQEIEAEELLPSIEALSEEAMQPVQPCKWTAKVQAQEEAVGCMAGCAVAPNVTPHATVQPAPNCQEFERTRDLAAGCAVARVAADGDAFACLKDGSYGLKPAGSGDQKAGQATDTPPRRGDGDAHMLGGSLDDYPELPTFLDRRKRPHGHETRNGGGHAQD